VYAGNSTSKKEIFETVANPCLESSQIPSLSIYRRTAVYNAVESYFRRLICAPNPTSFPACKVRLFFSVVSGEGQHELAIKQNEKTNAARLCGRQPWAG
jgi:hypothetical protein